MTSDEFLEALKQTPREGWFMSPRYRHNSEIRPAIRFTGGTKSAACPLVVVTDWRGDSWALMQMAGRLGLAHDYARDVMIAADGNENHDPQLRAQLIEAVGLPPEEVS